MAFPGTYCQNIQLNFEFRKLAVDDLTVPMPPLAAVFMVLGSPRTADRQKAECYDNSLMVSVIAML